jgi:hypothetical protein
LKRDASILLQLRELARAQPDQLVRNSLQRTADDLQSAIAQFGSLPTPDNLATVNGLYARAVFLLGMHNTPRTGGNGAGLREGARLAA